MSYYLKVGINEEGKVYTKMIPKEIYEEERKRIERIPKLLAPHISNETERKSTKTTRYITRQV